MNSNTSSSPLLFADDDDVIRKLLGYQFERANLKCDAFESGDLLLQSLSHETLVCLLDLNMPGKSGIECLKQIKKTMPHVEVLIMTNVNQAAEALEAIRAGAFDYITKPFDVDHLIRSVRKAMSLSRNQRENEDLRSTISEPGINVEQISLAPSMIRVWDLIQRIAPTDNSLLLTGESGTGKTLMAHQVHSLGKRAKGPFISVSCPSLPKDLLESEMFGHEKGSFSGAISRRLGRAELANGGTLFLDEIGEIPLSLQAKLLTFLQDKTFYRLGGEKPIQSDVRIIAATNRNLIDLVTEGQFREDLYFRLNVLPIDIPPLRERPEDLPQLLNHFVANNNKESGNGSLSIEDGVVAHLATYNWPGNVREMENLVTRAYTLRKESDKLLVEDFDLVISRSTDVDTTQETQNLSTGPSSLGGMTLAEVESLAIKQTLEITGQNKSKAARMLGIAVKSIYNKMGKYKLI
jgi:two-component system response regulator HydG